MQDAALSEQEDADHEACDEDGTCDGGGASLPVERQSMRLIQQQPLTPVTMQASCFVRGLTYLPPNPTSMRVHAQHVAWECACACAPASVCMRM